MAEQGINQINSLKQKWISYRLLANTISAAACAIPLAALLHFFLLIPFWWGILIFSTLLVILLFINKPWLITPFTVSSFLNQNYPVLEESAELTIKSPDELTFLQRLQLAKIQLALNDVPSLPQQFTRNAKRASLLLLAVVLFSFAITKIPHRTGKSNLFSSETAQKALAPEKLLPQIASVNLIIQPPSYTGKSKRTQDRFTVLAEEGALVKWEVATNIAVNNLSLIFNDREQIALRPNSDKTGWYATKTINKPGFYQVSVDGKLSDLYQVETIKDNPPVIRVKTPKQYTYIDAGEKPRTILNTTINDDYGVSDALIYATVAKGSGEGVKFKEYKIPFSESFQNHTTAYNLQHLFELPKLNMEPGDELYFYIEAEDNHQQKSRTDVYTVSIQDTAVLLSIDGIVNGSNLKPEFFRSERQIIMDTEHLLKSKDTISKEKFNAASGDMGVDQKLLRLRYGKFLGEEDESNVGGAGNNSDLAKTENFNNEAMILDAYTDKHDNAEDATFLEGSVKNQLKATLTEMWNAELHLRMYKPEEALPYEYKALRLLKDLQQKSRAYVAKTAYNPTPLKMEKRLTGDLGKIGQPVNKQDIKTGADAFESLKSAVQILEQIRITRIYSEADKHTLQLAKQQLSLKASAEPGIYLAAVSALNRVMAALHPQINDINMVEHAIQKTLPLSARVPQSNVAGPDMGLAQRYYQNLKNNR